MAGASARVPFVGLTGGIAAGKTEALRALERLGAATLSSDAVVHELLTSDEVRDRLVEELGPAVAPDGEVDRGKVAEQVFGDDERREWLEGILWPRVGQRIHEWRTALDERGDPPRAAVVEVPLLFEGTMEPIFDATISISAGDAERERRAAERGTGALEARSGRQLSQEEKAARATHAISNDGSLEDLEAELRRLYPALETAGR